MTHTDDPKDEDWLIALRGEEGHQLSEEESQTADAIRLALQRRAEEIDKVVPTPDRAGLDRIQQEVRRNKTRFLGSYFSSPRVWAVAASLMVVAVLTILFIPRLAERTPETIPHFASVANIVSASDPHAKAFDIVAALGATDTPWVFRGGRNGSEETRPPGDILAGDPSPDIKRWNLEDGSVVLQMPASESNLEVLREFRLEPVVQDGMVEIKIVPEPPR